MPLKSEARPLPPGSGSESWFGFAHPDRPLDAPLSRQERARLLDILRRAAEPDGLAPHLCGALDTYYLALCAPGLNASGSLRAARILLRVWNTRPAAPRASVIRPRPSSLRPSTGRSVVVSAADPGARTPPMVGRHVGADYVPEPMVVPLPDAAAAHRHGTPTPDLPRGREPILAVLLELPPTDITEPVSPLSPVPL